jgi:hypothetical protein
MYPKCNKSSLQTIHDNIFIDFQAIFEPLFLQFQLFEFIAEDGAITEIVCLVLSLDDCVFVIVEPLNQFTVFDFVL